MKLYSCECYATLVGPDGMQFCPYCGSALKLVEASPDPPSVIAVLVPPDPDRVAAILQGECREEKV